MRLAIICYFLCSHLVYFLLLSNTKTGTLRVKNAIAVWLPCTTVARVLPVSRTSSILCWNGNISVTRRNAANSITLSIVFFGTVVVYDITNPDSFTGAKSWVKELQRRGDPNVVIALAGNKADLEGRRKVEFEEANAYAEENGILHLETSAKNANNVKALFVEIAKKLPKTPLQPEREAFPIMPQQQEKSNCC
jgi:hypothetical protein